MSPLPNNIAARALNTHQLITILLTVLFTVIVSVYKLFITNYLPFPCLYEISVNENRMVGALYNTIHLVTLGSTRGGTTTVCVFEEH